MPLAEILEALTATQAQALVQKVIDPRIVELQRRLSPLLANIPRKAWNSTTYYFDRTTQFGSGSFVRDGGAVPQSSSTYDQLSWDIALVQAVGGVTGYARAVTGSFGDLRAREIRNTTRGQVWDLETALGWGNAAATANGPNPMFDGLDNILTDFTSDYANAIDYAGAAFDTGVLDQLIATVRHGGRGWNPTDRSQKFAFIAGTTLEDRMSQLLQQNQRFMTDVPHLSQVTINGGLNVAAYRDIPIIPSAYLDPTGVAMGAVTTATATTGGTLAAATYYYKVTSVIARFGETGPCAEVNQTTTGTTSTVTLSFTPPTGPDGYGPLFYKVYRSTATGAEKLLGVVDANVGLQSDNITRIPTTSIVDTGSALVPQNGATVPSTLPTAYYGGSSSMTPPAASGQNIYLLPLDDEMVVRPFIRDMQLIDLYPTTSAPDTLPFAVVSDTCLAVRNTRAMARARNVAVSVAS